MPLSPGKLVGYDDARRMFKFTMLNGAEVVQCEISSSAVNHQTHHRGQAHACLSILTGDEPPSLDLLVFQRGGTAPDLEKLTSR